jgi:hypothetical protein
MRMTYIGILRFLKFGGLARAMLNLKSVQNHSTLVSFIKKLNTQMLDFFYAKNK